jgi:hypothetical protein
MSGYVGSSIKSSAIAHMTERRIRVQEATSERLCDHSIGAGVRT